MVSSSASFAAHFLRVVIKLSTLLSFSISLSLLCSRVMRRVCDLIIAVILCCCCDAKRSSFFVQFVCTFVLMMEKTIHKDEEEKELLLCFCRLSREGRVWNEDARAEKTKRGERRVGFDRE